MQKNTRRAERLGAEIDIIKKFTPDEITKAAINCKKTLEEVCKQVSFSVYLYNRKKNPKQNKTKKNKKL